MKKVVVLIYIVLFQPIICFADIDYNFYGIVKATALYSNRPLSSFAYLNSSAPTSAGETTGVVGVNSNEDIWTMQVAQSRVGVDLIQEDIFGNLEFDFINFAQSSPTTESRPRLRRAFVGIAINNNNKLQIGQDWDTFSVQKPVTLDYVGLFFNAGNTGFMRQQMKWRYSQENFQSELSLGMPGKNPSSEYNYTEANSLPVVAYAVNYAGFGISALYSSLKKNVQEREDIWGFNLNYGGSLSSVLKIVAEFYYGQNIDDAGLLGLGKYTSNTNIKEVGGYLNLIYHNESYGDWILGYGAASVVNKEDVVNYSYNTTTQKITENGILNNSLTRLYWSFPLSNSLSLAFETSYFNTKRKVASLDKVTEALSFESGFLYKF